MAILRNKDYPITINLTEAEKALGVDLKLTKEGDLELNNLQDMELIAGGSNAAQAVRLKLETEVGALPFHPELGTDLLVGSKTVSAVDIKAQITRSLLKDPRITKVESVVDVIGNTILVDLRITLKNTGLEVPLKFVVER
jgi:hypothetical protein